MTIAYLIGMLLMGEKKSGRFEERKYVDVYVFAGAKPTPIGEVEITDLDGVEATTYLAQTPYKVTLKGSSAAQHKFIVSSVGQWRVEEHYYQITASYGYLI